MRLGNTSLNREVGHWNNDNQALSNHESISACVAGVSNVWSGIKDSASRVVASGSTPISVSGVLKSEATLTRTEDYALPQNVHSALLLGIQNRHGVVAISAPNGARVFPELSQHLAQREYALVLTDGVYLHALDAKNPEGLNGQLWHAVVSVLRDFPKRGSDLLSVPVTEVTHEVFDADRTAVCDFHQQQVNHLLPAKDSESSSTSKPARPYFIRERMITPQTPPTAKQTPAVSEPSSTPQKSSPTQLSKQLAYQERQLENHCGISAINAFLQTKQTTSVDAVKQVVEAYLSLLIESQRLRLPGLFHPKVLNAVQRGQSVEISRAEFFGEYAPTAHLVVIKPDGARRPRLLDEMYHLPDTVARLSHSSKHIERARLEAQWKGFFDKGFENNDQEGWNQPKQTIRINADRWVSVFGGLGPEHVLNLLNAALQTSNATNQANTAFKLPECVDMMVPNLTSIPRLYHKLRTAVAGYKTQQLMFLVGKNLEQSHYITLVRDVEHDWLLVDSLHASTKEGIHPAPVFSNAQDLPERLLAYAQDTPILRLIADKRVVTALNTRN